ncbi:MAG: ribosome maturation factor [Hymenobacteraceae bacterium]|nr:ribosome maturation factor [Hymenobacteraceae bacterium]MDX5397057.1 ribosome maturation factor [Hymenobacteraceae bacterium]MDX5513128.1 ribosome maturation factor [Hymenobacteraceae bacterium]
MNIVADTIKNFAEECLPAPDLYVVNITVSEAVRPKITVIADGDNGISIDQCAKMSRCINRKIEETYGEEVSYVLEVTSPGIDQPLTTPRQYQRNVGRTLKIVMKDGSTKTGKLEGVTPDGIDLTEEIKEKKKKPTFVPVHLPFEEIAKTNIVISFK